MTPSDEEMVKILEEMHDEGRKAVLTEGRSKGFAESLTVAVREAFRTCGCEVRVTCRNASEAVYARTILDAALDHYGMMIGEKSTIDLIELKNGSCIRIFREKEPDFESGADALKESEPDGSGSMRA